MRRSRGRVEHQTSSYFASLRMTPHSRVHALLRRVVDIRAHEVRAVITSFGFFFFLLSAYFVLRPMRDAVAAASGVSKLPR